MTGDREARSEAGVNPGTRGRWRRLALVSAMLGGTMCGTAANTTAQESLPLVERPAAGEGELLAVMVSGDGDWSAADRAIATSLVGRGIPVVGLETRSYLRAERRTPEGLARDLEDLTRRYLQRWNRSTVVFIGYSRGASIGPVGLSLWPSDLRRRLGLIVLLGPERAAGFEFHWVDLVRSVTRPGDVPVLPAMERLRGTPMLCIYGSEELGSLCRGDHRGLFVAQEHPGGHRVGAGPEAADLILAELDKLHLTPAG